MSIGRDMVLIVALALFVLPIEFAPQARDAPATNVGRAAGPALNNKLEPASRRFSIAVRDAHPTMLTAAATTWYVRPDGGSPEQCTGLVNAPYPGGGTNQPCAWDHPFRALPPGGPPRIAGGDSLIIQAGSYMMGYGAPGADNPDVCDPDYPWDCHMPPLPSGPDPAHPTRILGAGWDAGCSNPPQLWGTERADLILHLTGSSNIEVACLEITDHSGCVEDHTGGLACERESFPFGDWAVRGIYAEDSANVYLKDLNIHGLASAGIHAGRLTDWRVESVRLAGNGWVGWDGDIDGDDSNSGDMLFRYWRVEWNGCGETWPGGQPTGCWAQTAGGYGDGVGTGTTGGHWVIEDSAFLHNTSDGLDLLYAREPGSLIEIRRTIAEGNAGNQIKTNGPTHIENSIIVGNCGFFEGQPFSFQVDPCRAAGNALSLNLGAGDQATLLNSTLASEGDCLVLAECEGDCNGTEQVLLRNNIFQGRPDFLSDDQTCLIYQETFPHHPFDIDYSVIADVKDNLCPGPHDICGEQPGLVNTSIDAFDAHLLPDSPAIDAGTTSGAPSDDFEGRARDARPDIGAYEWQQAAGSPLCSAPQPPLVTDFPGRPLAAALTSDEGGHGFAGRFRDLTAKDQGWQLLAQFGFDQQAVRQTPIRELLGWTEMNALTISRPGNTSLTLFDDFWRFYQLVDDAHPPGVLGDDRELKNRWSLLRMVGQSDLAIDAQESGLLIYADEINANWKPFARQRSRKGGKKR